MIHPITPARGGVPSDCFPSASQPQRAQGTAWRSRYAGLGEIAAMTTASPYPERKVSVGWLGKLLLVILVIAAAVVLLPAVALAAAIGGVCACCCC